MRYTTLELKVYFVRPLTATAGLVSCEGLVLSARRQVATAEGRIVDASGPAVSFTPTALLPAACPLLRP